jgi:hypothetical protein
MPFRPLNEVINELLHAREQGQPAASASLTRVVQGMRELFPPGMSHQEVVRHVMQQETVQVEIVQPTATTQLPAPRRVRRRWMDPVDATPTPDATPRYGDAFELMTESRPTGRRRYGAGFPRRQESHYNPQYRPAREIPLTSREACRCADFTYHVAPWLLDNERLRSYREDFMEHQRAQALGRTGQLDYLDDRNLVERRQARDLAGLDVSELDFEISRRVLEKPGGWGWIGEVLSATGWVGAVAQEGAGYRLG